MARRKDGQAKAPLLSEEEQEGEIAALEAQAAAAHRANARLLVVAGAAFAALFVGLAFHQALVPGGLLPHARLAAGGVQPAALACAHLGTALVVGCTALGGAALGSADAGVASFGRLLLQLAWTLAALVTLFWAAALNQVRERAGLPRGDAARLGALAASPLLAVAAGSAGVDALRRLRPDVAAWRRAQYRLKSA